MAHAICSTADSGTVHGGYWNSSLESQYWSTHVWRLPVLHPQSGHSLHCSTWSCGEYYFLWFEVTGHVFSPVSEWRTNAQQSYLALETILQIRETLYIWIYKLPPTNCMLWVLLVASSIDNVIFNNNTYFKRVNPLYKSLCITLIGRLTSITDIEPSVPVQDEWRKEPTNGCIVDDSSGCPIAILPSSYSHILNSSFAFRISILQSECSRTYGYAAAVLGMWVTAP